MTENDKVMVQLPGQQKTGLPFSMYLLIFLQMLLMAFIGFKCVELVDIGYTLIALDMGVILP